MYAHPAEFLLGNMLGVVLGLATGVALLLRSSRCRPKDKEALAVSDD